MMRAVQYMVLGYLSGSILFARICAKCFHKPQILEKSKDGNPGTANAFQYGGFCCGVITLAGDLAKGLLPVLLYIRGGGDFAAMPIASALVLAAPVVGHAFPIYYGFQGGKGIAVTFGCLLGLSANRTPVFLLALLFLFFSLILRVTPHFSRTIVTYIATFYGLLRLHEAQGIVIGFGLITAVVFLRMYQSKEQRERMKVNLLWRH